MSETNNDIKIIVIGKSGSGNTKFRK